MSRVISWSKTYAANEVERQHADVNDSRFNPLEATSRVTVYAKSSLASTKLTFGLGGETHAEDIELPVDAGSLSTRDHKVAEGYGLKNQKITVGGRVDGATTPTVVGMVVIEPL